MTYMRKMVYTCVKLLGACFRVFVKKKLVIAFKKFRLFDVFRHSLFPSKYMVNPIMDKNLLFFSTRSR